ncbi:hypothetical protein OG205_10935 [Lentzea sp. NBC_00516]|nr:hypothetical protein [Lentzea sp. NBC_00516]WUD27478.1 hypothetical protein OG205_10935 [Lentzea sp. NBC_00516]
MPRPRGESDEDGRITGADAEASSTEILTTQGSPDFLSRRRAGNRAWS